MHLKILNATSIPDNMTKSSCHCRVGVQRKSCTQSFTLQKILISGKCSEQSETVSLKKPRLYDVSYNILRCEVITKGFHFFPDHSI